MYDLLVGLLQNFRNNFLNILFDWETCKTDSRDIGPGIQLFSDWLNWKKKKLASLLQKAKLSL